MPLWKNWKKPCETLEKYPVNANKVVRFDHKFLAVLNNPRVICPTGVIRFEEDLTCEGATMSTVVNAGKSTENEFSAFRTKRGQFRIKVTELRKKLELTFQVDPPHRKREEVSKI